MNGGRLTSSTGRSLNSWAVLLSATALSFILIALLVVTSSRAAFTATTSNTGNSASTASLTLTDNDSGTALFNVTDLMPGEWHVRCIRVTYTGGLDPMPVKLYASSAPTGDLAPYLNLKVDIGEDTGGVFRTCDTFTSTGTVYNGALTGLPASYGSGLSTWNPAGAGETRTFQFALQVQDTDAAQGKTATFGFTWETRSSN